jgi:hypothetical protein
MRRLSLVVPEAVADRLDRLAAAEFRDRKQEAAALLVEAITRAERRGAIRRAAPSSPARET